MTERLEAATRENQHDFRQTRGTTGASRQIFEKEKDPNVPTHFNLLISKLFLTQFGEKPLEKDMCYRSRPKNRQYHRKNVSQH